MDVFKRAQLLNFPLGKYILIGSTSMEAHGIRSAADIDVCVVKDLFKNLQANDWEIDTAFKEKWNRTRLKKGDVEVYEDFEFRGGLVPIEELITEAEIINGFPFLPLKILLEFKRVNGREKDFKDIELIETYLKTIN